MMMLRENRSPEARPRWALPRLLNVRTKPQLDDTPSEVLAGPGGAHTR